MFLRLSSREEHINKSEPEGFPSIGFPLAEPAPANLPDGAEAPLQQSPLDQWRKKEKPSDGNLLESADQYTIGNNMEPDLSPPSPETSKHPPDQFLRFVLDIFGDERKRKSLEANGEPAVAEVLGIFDEAVEPCPVRRRPEILIDLGHR